MSFIPFEDWKKQWKFTMSALESPFSPIGEKIVVWYLHFRKNERKIYIYLLKITQIFYRVESKIIIDMVREGDSCRGVRYFLNKNNKVYRISGKCSVRNLEHKKNGSIEGCLFY